MLVSKKKKVYNIDTQKKGKRAVSSLYIVMKLFRNVMIIFFLIMTILIVSGCLYYNNQISAVDKNDDKEIEVLIKDGATSREIGNVLKNSGLIRNADFFVLYLKLYKITNLKASTYKLSKNMTLKEIIEVIQKGNNYNPDEIAITFREGINIRKIAAIIESNTNNSYDEVFNLLKDEKYIDTLIEEYWFLTSDIKSNDIYYPLEGYLFPDTYNFSNKNVSIKDIFKAMLNQMNAKLTPFKEKIEESSFSVHEFLTLASVVELEGTSDKDRPGVASVFYNRLSKNMSLGSDVTTYYAIKVDMSERDLYKAEIQAYNPYNTRGPKMEGKLPVGPICSSGLASINASINPSVTDYLYFVADKYKEVYFTKTYAEHTAKVQEIKDKGEWITW